MRRLSNRRSASGCREKLRGDRHKKQNEKEAEQQACDASENPGEVTESEDARNECGKQKSKRPIEQGVTLQNDAGATQHARPSSRGGCRRALEKIFSFSNGRRNREGDGVLMSRTDRGLCRTCCPAKGEGLGPSTHFLSAHARRLIARRTIWDAEFCCGCSAYRSRSSFFCFSSGAETRVEKQKSPPLKNGGLFRAL